MTTVTLAVAALRATATDVLHNLYAGLRLGLLLPVGVDRFRPGLAQILILGVISLGLNLVYDLYLAWPGAEFSIAGLYYQSLLYLLFFASIIFMAAVAGAAVAALPLAVMILAVAPTTFAVYTGIVFGIGYVPHAPDWVYRWLTPVYLGWYLFIVLRAIRLTLAPAPPRAAALLMVFGLGNILPWYYLPPEPLWTLRGADTAGAEPPPDVEQLFFQQDELMAQGIKGLMEQRPGVVDVYFVGVAGDAAEDVFMNELQQAAHVFARDFDAAGRTLLLVNNRETFARLPLANRDNLNSALAAVGRRMDPAEDLLVLFMTSHGEEERGLVLDLDRFRLADITPRGLRAALDGAGIRYRAVIVSACFSGAFVEEFRDADSLVMTSARRDRSSFGCGHDGVFTYFGSAFLGTELPRDRSLVAAFERARESLGAREAQEGLPASEPQLWIGSGMEQLLERLGARLRAASPPVEPPQPPREAVSGRAPTPAGSGGWPVARDGAGTATLQVAAQQQPDLEQQPQGQRQQDL